VAKKVVKEGKVVVSLSEGLNRGKERSENKKVLKRVEYNELMELGSISKRIRYLNGLEWSNGEISGALGISRQFVSNVVRNSGGGSKGLKMEIVVEDEEEEGEEEVE
jgi:hypothetical protein